MRQQSTSSLKFMNVVYKFTKEQVEDLHLLYLQEWWSKSRTLEETASCVEGSQICIGLTNNDGKLVGFSRVLTDYTFKALILDVIVSESYRKLGLGDKLISLIKEHPELSKVQNFELYCLPEMTAFYQRHGFSEEGGELKLMRKAGA